MPFGHTLSIQVFVVEVVTLKSTMLNDPRERIMRGRDPLARFAEPEKPSADSSNNLSFPIATK